MEGDMRVTKLLYILWVSDMGRAIAFYRDSMGLTLRSESPSWSELTCGDATLALHISHNGGIGATGLSFEVDDIEAACRAAERGGGRVVNAPQNGDIPGLTLADIADPDGNRIQLGHHGG
jgi:predicted enzyme related to lactoylglutathione lyase